MTRRQRRRDHDERGARGDRPRRRRGGLAGRRARDRRRARTAPRSTRSSARGTLWQPRGLRQRIEHAQCLAPEDVPRFAELGVAVSVAVHARALRRAAREALLGRPPRRDVLVPLARSSRARCSRTAPTRRSRSSSRGRASSRPSSTTGATTSGSPLEQALHAICVAPAWLSHDERIRGTLVPGRYADLVVLDRDPFACEPEELREVQVVATMLGGRWTHNPPPWD